MEIEVELPLDRVDSNKRHGNRGPFNINLPIHDAIGIECRRGVTNNDYKIIYTFDPSRTITAVDNASVSHSPPGAGGTIASRMLGPNSNQYTVNLINVTDVQHLVVRLDGVHDNAGANLTNVLARMDVLIGDTTRNGAVNASDISQTKARSGQTATTGNFRSDVNAERCD